MVDNVQNISQYTIIKPLSKINTVYFLLFTMQWTHTDRGTLRT